MFRGKGVCVCGGPLSDLTDFLHEHIDLIFFSKIVQQPKGGVLISLAIELLNNPIKSDDNSSFGMHHQGYFALASES
jgi:hypothetical protein